MHQTAFSSVQNCQHQQLHNTRYLFLPRFSKDVGLASLRALHPFADEWLAAPQAPDLKSLIEMVWILQPIDGCSISSFSIELGDKGVLSVSCQSCGFSQPWKRRAASPAFSRSNHLKKCTSVNGTLNGFSILFTKWVTVWWKWAEAFDANLILEIRLSKPHFHALILALSAVQPVSLVTNGFVDPFNAVLCNV